MLALICVKYSHRHDFKLWNVQEPVGRTQHTIAQSVSRFPGVTKPVFSKKIETRIFILPEEVLYFTKRAWGCQHTK